MIIAAYFSKEEQNPAEESPNPSAIISFSTPPKPDSKSPSPAPTSPRPMPTVPVNTMIGNLPAAICSISGIITYISPNTYQSTNAKISYKNIDHPSRLVYWDIKPRADFDVGPNIFSGLKIPDGEHDITATMKKDIAPYKQYSLTARVTYGKFVNGDLKIFESQCSGETIISIAY
ncbi:MAG: hypothetical protein CEN90_346 [Parcubacteria group bacterium Licking1014_17]|nr:MAG: hypothetical protein CEN90_346 [Parcubacteria group bacterium Licking1014_17]